MSQLAESSRMAAAQAVAAATVGLQSFGSSLESEAQAVPLAALGLGQICRLLSVHRYPGPPAVERTYRS